MKNIELFDACAGYLFERLYAAFPICIDFVVDEEMEELLKIPETKKLVDDALALGVFEGEDVKTVISSTVLWLAHNGYVEFASSYPETDRPVIAMPYEYFRCLQLTQKGLGLMISQVPKSIRRSARLGDVIVSRVKDGALKEAGKLITDAIVAFGVERLAGER